MLPYIIAGITTGSVYALAAVGLVLTYKTSGIFNFAQGALATAAAYLFYTLNVQHHIAWPVAAAISVLVAGPILGVVLERLASAVSDSGLVIRVVAMVGVLLIIQSTCVAVFGVTQSRTVPQFLPSATIKIGSTPVGVSDIVIAVIGLSATAGLYTYFRLARTGVAMRAVVSGSQLLDLSGTNPTQVRRLAWVIGAAFACVSGVLLAPLTSLNSTNLTLLVVQAFGAAAIGRFSNLPLTYAGGLCIGVLASLATKYFNTGLLASLPPTLPFLFLFLLLLFSRRTSTSSISILRSPHNGSWRAPWQLQSAGGVVLLALLCVVPNVVGFHLDDWTSFLAATIVFLSLGLLVRTSGQVSLAHIAFVAIGASSFSHLTVGQHWPWGIALIASGLIAMPIGALLSIPAIRLSGLYLALATLGFSIVLSFMFYSQSYMFGASGTPLTEPRPHTFGLSSDKNFYYLVLGLTTIVCLAVVGLNRSRLGRLLRALSDSPRGLATSGTAINVTRVLVFCLSTFLASIGGALGGAATQIVSSDSFPPLLSLTYFAVVVISAGSEPWFALLAGAGLTLIPSYFPSSNTTTYLTLAFGFFALLYAVTPDHRRGVPPSLAALIDRWVRRKRPGVTSVVSPAEPSPHELQPAEMEVSKLRVRFGGVTAVDEVSLRVSTGTIVGLIGPNGAGKTTTFNVISGLQRPTSGQVVLNGNDVGNRSVSARARLGLGRTFQHMELFESQTVRQNVELGREGSKAGINPLAHLGGLHGHEVAATAAEAMSTCGISDLAERSVSSLSTGQRRLVELARCLAGPFRLLLLDEPSSGLDRVETQRFGEILLDAVRTRDVGILLVEHDMSLVTAVCDYIYVLDFGKRVFAGTPTEVLASPLVRSAYLGDNLLEDALESPVGGLVP